MCLSLTTAPLSAAQPAGQYAAPLRELTLEQLGEIVVTSVDKLPDDIWRTAAAVTVITADDIRRSGATSVPDVLRLAPGVEVLRIDSSHYSIGIRGFGEQFSKSLLILVDGRALYNQLFAGTYWPAHDIVLEDVERIEIIRGPGGTIWGGNAVNGVINIITRRAGATRGALVSVGTGTVDHGTATMRFGGSARGLDYRVFAKAFLKGAQSHTGSVKFDDDWWATQTGFRLDRTGTGSGTLMIAGVVTAGGHGQRVRIASFTPPAARIVDDPVDTSGGHLLARWEQRAGATDLQVQAYYDRTVWRASHFGETRDTIDVDVLQSARVTARNRLSWGGGLRWSDGRFVQTVPTLVFDPARQTDWLASAFVRNEFEIVPDRVSFIAGTKLERNIYTGVEWQPTARLLWRPADTQTIWLAVTRAVRTPSRIERAIRVSSFATATPFPVFGEVVGNSGFDSERAVSYAGGYRVLAGPPLFVDVTAFVNDHDGLAGFSRLPTQVVGLPTAPRAVIRFPFINAIDGRSRGFEIAPEWRAAVRWRLSGSYAYRHIALVARPENMDPAAVARYEGSTPSHLARVQSRLDLPRAIEIDAAWRYVSALPFRRVDGYHTADARIGWRPAPPLEIALSGHNLLQAEHLEFAHEPGPSVGISRSVAVQLTWRAARP